MSDFGVYFVIFDKKNPDTTAKLQKHRFFEKRLYGASEEIQKNLKKKLIFLIRDFL